MSVSHLVSTYQKGLAKMSVLFGNVKLCQVSLNNWTVHTSGQQITVPHGYAKKETAIHKKHNIQNYI